MNKKQQPMQRVKGVRDILPTAATLWRDVEDMAVEIFMLYNFHEIRLPVFEKTAVFTRSIGETSDIVEKEMYTFEDRGGESLTLRPEGTASVVRAYVENKLYNPPGSVTKLFYMGPMFRAERPQAGRYRQFYQLGAEVFGSDDPSIDAELILMLSDLLTSLDIKDLEIVLNSLGCPACRPEYRKKLTNYLKSRENELCENCRKRIDKNPLRALDCKSSACVEVAKDAPQITEFLCVQCSSSIKRVEQILMECDVAVRMDPKLVRGLDYYSRTAFEVISKNLGAQNSIAGGGRYDSLVEQFGGPPTPAIGFAIGMDRLMSLLEINERTRKPYLYVIGLTDPARNMSFHLAYALRNTGLSVERNSEGGSLKSQLRKAGKSGARFTIIIGEDEMAKSIVILKDMLKSEQCEVKVEDLADTIWETVDNEEKSDWSEVEDR